MMINWRNQIVVLFATFLPWMGGVGVLIAQSPKVIFTPQDQERFLLIMKELSVGPQQSAGQAMASAGRELLDTPYVEKTLETGKEEVLVVNLRGLDCTTFVENALAISWMVQSGDNEWEIYLDKLENIRYRYGERNGYPSRLHYFTEWIRDNSEKGIIEDITREIGGIRIEKPLNFMGTHPGSYPALDSDTTLGEIRRIEDSLSSIPYYYLPQDSVTSKEHLIEEGDIIALSTDISGLDVTHTGIAVRMSDGRIHLLHASTRGQVMVTAEPLQDYLRKIKRNTGIIVARPRVPEPK